MIMEKEKEPTMEEARNILKKRFEIILDFPKKGGQSTGNIPRSVKMVSLDLDIEIKVGFFRSQIRNKEYAQMLLEMCVDDLVK